MIKYVTKPNATPNAIAIVALHVKMNIPTPNVMPEMIDFAFILLTIECYCRPSVNLARAFIVKAFKCSIDKLLQLIEAPTENLQQAAYAYKRVVLNAVNHALYLNAPLLVNLCACVQF